MPPSPVRGLDMSLDELIKTQNKKKREHPENSRNNTSAHHSREHPYNDRKPYNPDNGRFKGNRRPFPGGYDDPGAPRVITVQRQFREEPDEWKEPRKRQHIERQYPYRQYQQRDRQQQDAQQAKCYKEEDGDVVVRLGRTIIVRVRSNGEVVLATGDKQTPHMLQHLNDALNLIGIRVSAMKEYWSISDGKSLTRFTEGVVLPAKGAQTANRAQKLLQAFNNPNRERLAAATAASNAAAAAAGLIPGMAGGQQSGPRGPVGGPMGMMLPPPIPGMPPPPFPGMAPPFIMPGMFPMAYVNNMGMLNGQMGQISGPQPPNFGGPPRGGRGGGGSGGPRGGPGGDGGGDERKRRDWRQGRLQ